MKAKDLRADVVIAGGGFGGCAAALAAARQGVRVAMIEETDWIGGQVTQQGVPPDEHPWMEESGRTRSYQDFRDGVRDYYRRHYPLTPAARRAFPFNPGNGRVSRLCFEPKVGRAVLEEMLAPHVAAGRIAIFLRHKPIAAEVTGDKVATLMVRDLESGHELVLHAPWFIDATELGDLLPMTGTEYVTGAESQAETGEPHAAEKSDPENMQAITWCFAMEYCPGEDHTVEKPENYDFWRDYTPEMRPPWTGKLLAWPYSNPRTLDARHLVFDPLTDDDNSFGLWTYRRILDAANFTDGFLKTGVTLVNWPHNDYLLGNIIDVPEEEAQRHLRGARQLSESLFYWLQTEAGRPDGGTGFPELRLRGDLLGTGDGLAKAPYVREARRIKADFTILEQHVGTKARMEATGKKEDEVTAESFPDSVGLGCYRIDLHPSTGGDNYVDVSSVPFEIPLGALIPKRMENLIPAAKNIGSTHITNGCYRLHPVEWNIGEVAGTLCAWCQSKGHVPRQVRNDRPKLEEFQAVLQQAGIPLRWPRIRPV